MPVRNKLVETTRPVPVRSLSNKAAITPAAIESPVV